MKRLVVLVVTLALVVVGSLAVSAQEFKISADAGYQLGSYKYTVGSSSITSSANGFVLGADAAISGPFGAQFKLASLSQSNFKDANGNPPPSDIKLSGSVFKMDFLGTYALPLDMDKVNLKGVVGYTMGTIGYDQEEVVAAIKYKATTKLSGISAGVQADFAVTEQIGIKGTFAYLPSVGVEQSYELNGVKDPTTDKGKGTALEFGVAGTYAIMPNLSVEAGYNNTSYSYKYDGTTTEVKDAFSGFFVGAKYTF